MTALFCCFFRGFLLCPPKGPAEAPRLGVALILEYVTSLRVHAFSFLILLLRQCNTWCGEAIVAKPNALMDNLAAV